MVGLKVTLRLRMAPFDAHYAGDLVDGARLLSLFGDLASELLIRLDGDEGVVRTYDSVEFLGPVFVGDYIEASAELMSVEETRREVRFEARKVITNARRPGFAPTAADPIEPPQIVARAAGTCLVPRALQRKARELYMPALPAGPAPDLGPIVTPEPPADVVLTAAVVAGRAAADEAARCRDAGAAVILVRVPEVDGVAVPPVERLARTLEAVRAKTDCILQVSTGSGATLDERAAPLRAHPEMASLICGTFTFGDEALFNSRRTIRALAERIRRADAMPLLECYDVGHFDEALALVEDGTVGAPLHVQFVLGVPGALAAREDHLRYLSSLVPHDATWSIGAVGRHQQAVTEAAMRLGGHARVGVEEDAAKDTASEGTASLVARAASFARSIGRTPADPVTARRLLGMVKT